MICEFESKLSNFHIKSSNIRKKMQKFESSFNFKASTPVSSSPSSQLSSLIQVKRDEILNYSSESNKRFFKESLNIEQTNIWLFGQPGVGKSKLTNSLFKSLHGVFDKETVAISGGSTNSHVTQDLKYIPLYSPILSGGKPGNVRVVDAWGNDGSNYDPTLFESILKGKVSNNSQQKSLKPSAKEDKSRQVHAIVFVVTASSCSSDQDCKMIAQYSKIAMQNNLYPILVITKVDCLNEEFKTHPEKIDSDPAVKKAVMDVCQNTGIEPDSVFCTRNLAVDIQKERNDFIVLRNLEILEACLSAADRFFEYKAYFSNENENVELSNSLVLNAKYIGDLLE
ncbi:predicted protein [Naegleria gruberi]|uniref:Predicted protein n=1 Tax=Naegleria gruberi TaxID=5762 RepID=D2VXM8_NAEGR|nr:uncharacterized protein NAEGRDRAFT_53062 [Naegleria gruberi]EFC38470.1 predicted protein [Naegleria gruberi]|eukprot:XP_002671214.1 predicted protein [Naegleria gruberi strain NEG-M]